MANFFYQPPPEIVRDKSFDSGFDTFHLVWPLGAKRYSARVQTEPIKLDPVKFENSMAAELDLQLKYVRCRFGWEPFVWLKINGRSNPNILFLARIEIRNGVHPRVKPLCRPPRLFKSDSSGNFQTWSCDFTERELDYLNFYKRIGEFVVHCWIDIPKKIDTPPQVHSFDFGPGSIADLWKEVIGERKESTPASSDVLLVVKNGDEVHRFNCHQIVLAMRSPVFAQLLAKCKVVDNNRSTIKLDGVEIEVIKYVLKYIYTDSVEFGSGTSKVLIDKVAAAADRFSLPELKEECWHESIPLYIVSNDHWLELLRSAEKFKMERLKKTCLVALSSDPRLFDDQNMRDQITGTSMVLVMELIKKREENTKVVEIR